MNIVNQRSQLKLLFFAIVCSFLLLLFELLGVFAPLYPFVYRLKIPFVSFATRLIQVGFTPYKIIKSNHKAYLRIQDLERSYSEALAEVAQLKGVSQENEYLKSLLGSSDIKAGKLLVTTSISAYGQPAILLPRDKELQIGNPILITGTVVGRIASLQQSQAQVALLSQDTASATLLAKTQRGVKGVVRGNGKRILLTEVSRNDELQVGDTVLTQGQEAVASDLFIGKVQEIMQDEAAPVQTALVEQIVSFYETNLVEVRIE